MQIKASLQNFALAVVSIVISYVVLEIGFRYYRFNEISGTMADVLYKMVQENDTFSTFDAEAGYRYLPNKTWINHGGRANTWRTDQYGLIANDIDTSAYPIEKPADEFRIAVLGDSFAASNAVYLRWADLLQDYLNRTPAWRSFTGGKFTRILNFGMDGTGVVQWGPVYEFNARRFSPDMVIVNVFIDDIMRQFIYRAEHHFRSHAEMRAFIKGKVKAALHKRMPWFGIYPELLAATIGPYVGLSERLVPTTSVTSEMFETQQEGLAASVNSLRRIGCLNPRLVVLYNPAIEEYQVATDDERRWPSTPRLVGLLGKFRQSTAAAGIQLVELAKLYPLAASERQVRQLYNWPIDTHMSDYGVVIYASWVFQYLLKWAETPAARASSAPSGCN
jgi:GDSL-like Lipase/Acylhydrolase